MKPLLFIMLILLLHPLAVQGDEVFEGPAGDPMHLPSQALPLPGGGFVVLDGARSRMAFFKENGAFERYVGRRGEGDGAFREPLGFCKAPGGTLVVADTGNARLQVLNEAPQPGSR